MIKKCLICGKDFEARTNKLYCSAACQKKGNAQTRKAWEAKTGYNEKRRSQASERKRIEEAKLQEGYEQRSLDRERRHEEIRKANRQALLDRASKGEPSALMQLARENGDHFTYWHNYKLDAITASESEGRFSTQEVNGISVYDPDFEELVISSINESGKCFQVSHGLGAKIPDPGGLTIDERGACLQDPGERGPRGMSERIM